MGGKLVSVTSNPLPSSDAAEWAAMRAGRRETTATPTAPEAAATIAPPDDLSRDVYCILGMPIDAIDMATAVARVEAAAAGSTPYLISTPNLNFLVNSLSNPEFRNSVLSSDLSTADGMPIVWIARLLGIPVRTRVAGSGMFDAFTQRRDAKQPVGVFMFGGNEGVAEAAGQALNARAGSVRCVGALYPGFGSLDDMSNAEVIDRINASKAGFLVVALGAEKGQSWLLRNHDRISVPVRAHLGAVINFQAGSVKRAPGLMQKTGLEWLWRIKEEPRLWRRYWTDGKALAQLMLTRVLPLAVAAQMARIAPAKPQLMATVVSQEYSSVMVKLSGHALDGQIGLAVEGFREAAALANSEVVVDLRDVKVVDQRFLGLLLMLRKTLAAKGAAMKVVGASKSVARSFRLNQVAYLLTQDGGRRFTVVRDERPAVPAMPLGLADSRTGRRPWTVSSFWAQFLPRRHV
jgi:N-acetylglucosaminyldiphosphoundecaprenol N-acetyl-beta-D-mannosaminyltransferase